MDADSTGTGTGSGSDNASTAADNNGNGQSSSLAHHARNLSDSQSDASSLNLTAANTTANTHSHPHRHHHQSSKATHHQKRPVGRLHTRSQSSRALHGNKSAHGPPGSKLTRRITSPPPETADAHGGLPRLSTIATASHSSGGGGHHGHRRATSEIKLPAHAGQSTSQASVAAAAAAAAVLPKSASHTNLKRNRSHVEIGKRNKSSEKLKRTSSGTGIHRSGKGLATKGQVHFDLGDTEEDEWVDASGSNSPYLSRKGSINSSAQSSAHASRPVTPSETTVHPEPSSSDKERLDHKQYLTSRLLRRTPSHGAPPMMTADTATMAPVPQSPPDSRSPEQDDAPTIASSGGDNEGTSRFIAAASSGSGIPSEGSFYTAMQPGSNRSEELPHRPRSMASLAPSQDSTGAGPLTEPDNSALTPRSARRRAAPPAETSRTQQKLNLQRASSVLEPGQPVNGVGPVMGVGATPLIGVGGPGYDGGSSRDPRVSKLLERTGMEYLVVRRYQNPIARSLRRLGQLPSVDKTRRIPRASTASVNGNLGPGGIKRPVDLAVRHNRNVSMPEQRRPATPRQGSSIRTNGTRSSFEVGEDEGRVNERLSGSSLAGEAHEDGTAALLRNLWEKPLDLSASTD